MKKITSLFFILTLVSFVSCQSFLDTVPQDTIVPQFYYQTEAQLTFAMNGVYSELGADYQYAQGWHTRTDAPSDETYSTQNSVPGVLNHQPSDVSNVGAFRSCYEGINRANALIENIDKVLARGEKIELLVNKTQQLSDSSVSMRKTVWDS